jgi:hypothetical protein
MVTFTPSPAFVDLIINHPDVRPTVQQGTDELDSEDIVTNPDNFIQAYEGGVAVFVGLGEGVFEGHIFALPASRGAEALRFGKLALQALFTKRRACRLVAQVPLQLPAARVYCRRLGLKSESRDLFYEFFSTEKASWAV